MSRRVFIDCGVREGDAIAAFLGDTSVGGGAYFRCLRPRPDADGYEIVGFESPHYARLAETRRRFEGRPFELIESLAWIADGSVEFDTDGEADDSRIFAVSRTEGREPWRHWSAGAVVRPTPCVDLAAFLTSRYTRQDHLVLKLDIEGAEYDVLLHLVQTRALDLLSELYVEYHWWGHTEYRPAIEAAIRRRRGLYYRSDWP